VLRSPHLLPADVAAAEEARAKFLAWHSASLIDNFVALLLVTLALALAPRLPEAGGDLAAKRAVPEVTVVDEESTMRS
jgi:hypothetical protein